MPERNPRWYGVHRCAGRRTAQVQGKAAVLRDLLEHVAKNPRPVAMELGPSRDKSTSTCTSVSLVLRCKRARRACPRMRCAIAGHVSCGPPSKRMRSPAPEVRRELHIRVPIAHHEAARGVECASREILPHHPGPGFAAFAFVPFEMRTDEYFIELDALRREQLQDEPVAVRISPRKTGGPQSILVGHHDEPEPGALQVSSAGMTPA